MNSLKIISLKAKIDHTRFTDHVSLQHYNIFLILAQAILPQPPNIIIKLIYLNFQQNCLIKS